MKIEDAIAQIQKEADFLGMSCLDVVGFIKRSPLAFPNKTVEAMKVLEKFKLA